MTQINDSETLIYEPIGGCPFCDHHVNALKKLLKIYERHPESDIAKDQYNKARNEYHVHHDTHVSSVQKEKEGTFLDTFAELGGAYFTYAFKKSVLSRAQPGDTRYNEVLDAMDILIKLARADQSEEGKAFFAFTKQVDQIVTAFVDMKEHRAGEEGQEA